MKLTIITIMIKIDLLTGIFIKSLDDVCVAKRKKEKSI